MQLMEEKIRTEGTVLPGGILKVGSFLNQQIDTAFHKYCKTSPADCDYK